jgi:hypothetical protein
MKGVITITVTEDNKVNVNTSDELTDPKLIMKILLVALDGIVNLFPAKEEKKIIPFPGGHLPPFQPGGGRLT